MCTLKNNRTVNAPGITYNQEEPADPIDEPETEGEGDTGKFLAALIMLNIVFFILIVALIYRLVKYKRNFYEKQKLEDSAEMQQLLRFFHMAVGQIGIPDEKVKILLEIMERSKSI